MMYFIFDRGHKSRVLANTIRIFSTPIAVANYIHAIRLKSLGDLIYLENRTHESGGLTSRLRNDIENRLNQSLEQFIEENYGSRQFLPYIWQAEEDPVIVSETYSAARLGHRSLIQLLDENNINLNRRITLNELQDNGSIA